MIVFLTGCVVALTVGLIAVARTFAQVTEMLRQKIDGKATVNDVAAAIRALDCRIVDLNAAVEKKADSRRKRK